MKANPVYAMAITFIVAFLVALAAPAQVPAPSQPIQAEAQFTPAQLDQLLAPIALYPDPLLAQILMSATYPLEVVEADRWIRDPQNAALKADQLTTAVEKQSWDPSIKSLAPFPQILSMMDNNLDWTERLGEAFLADQSAVMDSTQRLRQRAETAGKLRSTSQQIVATEGQTITIEPPNPEIVYVPIYDPTVVYGVWPYPMFWPYYFPGVFDGVFVDGFGFGWFGIGIVEPLWGWHRWDWRHHGIYIDRGRFAALNNNRPPIGGGAWQHDPSHRLGVPYGISATRGRFPGVSAPPDGGRSFRGYPNGSLPQVVRPRATPPTIESYGRGEDVRAQAERGYQSRSSMPSFSSGGTGSRSAPPSGGRTHR
jgi:hypothetical protein